MENIKYKHAESEGWFYSFDKNGNKSQSWNKKNRPVMYKQMMEWVEDGNEIEPQFTAKELAAKKAEEAAQALAGQKQTLLNLIKDNEYHLISRRFASDKEVWETALDEWAGQLSATELIEIYPKPF